MQIDSFQAADPTPKRTNICPQPTFLLPFSFKGVALQSTAQKLIINLITFIDKLADNQAVWVGSSMHKAGIALGIDYKTVLKVKGNWEKNEIKTPGKKRPASVLPVLSQFDFQNRTCQAKSAGILQQKYATFIRPSFQGP